MTGVETELAQVRQELARWKRQSDDWQKRGWELGAALDTAEAELRVLKTARPDTPTQGMIEAGVKALGKMVDGRPLWKRSTVDQVTHIYQDMIAAGNAHQV